MSKQEIKPTSISPHLQELIDVANRSISTLKEQIIEIYETAKTEGFTPQEARILIEVKVVKFSDRYLRRILPDEAKDQSKVRVAKDFEDEDFTDNGEEVVNSTTDHVNFAEQVPQIPAPVTEIKDAETVPEEELIELPDPRKEDPEQDSIDRLGKEIFRLSDEVTQLTAENTKLRMEKVGTLGNKFAFEYDLEVKDQILPLIVTAFPDKKDGYVRIDKTRLEKNKK